MIKPRTIYKRIESSIDAPEAIVITGMRRTGKTTLLKYIFGKINSMNSLFLDLENPLNRKYFEEENFEKIKPAFEILGLDFTQRSYIFLDEIQLSKKIPSVVKYFIDHYQVKFFLTGSASFYLKNLFTESLSGRKFIFELFPLTFREFLLFKDSKLKIPRESSTVTQPVYDRISALYDEYLYFGGFPGVVLKTNAEEKKRALEDIFTSFFQLEVLQLGDFRRNDAIRDLMLLLMQRTGSKLDIQKLSRELRISRPTLSEYIAFLESTYFIKTVKPFSRGRSSEIRKSPKVYLCDTGLANHLARLDPGRLFENSVFQCLWTSHKLNYYQRKSGAEIDFIVDENKALEVKLAPAPSDFRKLKEMAAQLDMREAKIVSKSFYADERVIYAFML